ncbi:MAG: hypothetical protein JJV99_10570 [Colwellia sp.]|nr:hypothetical protein [Colwellia sp.]
MIRNVIIIICIFNILACKPVGEKSLENVKHYPFSCLSSQNSCNLDTEYGDFIISFSGLTEEGKLKTELPFDIQVEFKANKNSHQLVSIQSYLEGKDMFMGKVPVFFQLNENKNRMQAQTLLANCSEEVMTWNLWLIINIAVDDKVEQERLLIEFDSIRL